MIGLLKGTLIQKQPPFLWLDVQGVGYEIEAPMSTFYVLPEVNQTARLFIHTHVREDALLLFGFATEAEKQLYRILLKVNGVGAKMALAILSSMSVSEFVQLVDSNDSLGLTRIPGVGKKTAERLVIDMRDRLKEMTPLFSSSLDAGGEQIESSALTTAISDSGIHSVKVQSAQEALTSLGYKATEAERLIKLAIKQADTELSLEALIKAALQVVKLK